MTRRTLFSAASLGALALAACAPSAEQADAPAAEEVGELSEAVTSVTDVTPTEAAAMISSNPELVVLDVRTPEEFAAGHIGGAINLNVRGDDFATQLAKLDRDASYVLHCKSGARSAAALEVMKEQKFETVAHLTQGFDGWQEEGLEVRQ